MGPRHELNNISLTSARAVLAMNNVNYLVCIRTLQLLENKHLEKEKEKKTNMNHDYILQT